MKRLLGGALVGLLIAGAVAAVAVPMLPAAAQRSWIVWTIAAVTVAAAISIARRTAKTPPR